MWGAAKLQYQLVWMKHPCMNSETVCLGSFLHWGISQIGQRKMSWEASCAGLLLLQCWVSWVPEASLGKSLSAVCKSFWAVVFLGIEVFSGAVAPRLITQWRPTQLVSKSVTVLICKEKIIELNITFSFILLPLHLKIYSSMLFS